MLDHASRYKGSDEVVIKELENSGGAAALPLFYCVRGNVKCDVCPVCVNCK
jgi:hypothetical protein